jgi:hypothetical protein
MPPRQKPNMRLISLWMKRLISASGSSGTGRISRLEGLILLSVFVGYEGYLVVNR